MSLRHILFATGGFDGTSRVADVSAALAKPANARLSIVTVGQDTPEEEESGVLARTRRNVERAVNPDEILQNAKERAQHNSVLDVGVQLERGDPAKVIIKNARRNNVDAIVMGRRGRGFVSQKVASLAPCIVIVVPCA